MKMRFNVTLQSEKKLTPIRINHPRKTSMIQRKELKHLNKYKGLTFLYLKSNFKDLRLSEKIGKEKASKKTEKDISKGQIDLQRMRFFRIFFRFVKKK